MKIIDEYKEIYKPYRRKNKLYIYSYDRFRYYRKKYSLEEVLDLDNTPNWGKAYDYGRIELSRDIVNIGREYEKQYGRFKNKEGARQFLEYFLKEHLG